MRKRPETKSRGRFPKVSVPIVVGGISLKGPAPGSPQTISVTVAVPASI